MVISEDLLEFIYYFALPNGDGSGGRDNFTASSMPEGKWLSNGNGWSVVFE